MSADRQERPMDTPPLTGDGGGKARVGVKDQKEHPEEGGLSRAWEVGSWGTTPPTTSTTAAMVASEGASPRRV